MRPELQMLGQWWWDMSKFGKVHTVASVLGMVGVFVPTLLGRVLMGIAVGAYFALHISLFRAHKALRAKLDKKGPRLPKILVAADLGFSQKDTKWGKGKQTPSLN